VGDSRRGGRGGLEMEGRPVDGEWEGCSSSGLTSGEVFETACNVCVEDEGAMGGSRAADPC